MEPTLLSTQISIFLHDGVMNPLRYEEPLNDNFDGIFTNKIFAVTIPNVPDEMPILKYTSSDESITYEFARKRLNFFMNFKDYSDEQVASDTLEEYKSKIKAFIKNQLLVVTDIERIGIAVFYYIDLDDDKAKYWSSEYKFPFVKKDTNELTYIINNPFNKFDLTFNSVLTLTNETIQDNRIVPIVSIDINNKEVSSLSKNQINSIMDNITQYKKDELLKILENK